jgi:hypothetical protein
MCASDPTFIYTYYADVSIKGVDVLDFTCGYPTYILAKEAPTVP